MTGKSLKAAPLSHIQAPRSTGNRQLTLSLCASRYRSGARLSSVHGRWATAIDRIYSPRRPRFCRAVSTDSATRSGYQPRDCQGRVTAMSVVSAGLPQQIELRAWRPVRGARRCGSRAGLPLRRRDGGWCSLTYRKLRDRVVDPPRVQPGCRGDGSATAKQVSACAQTSAFLAASAKASGPVGRHPCPQGLIARPMPG